MVNFQEKPENKPFLIKIKRFSHSDQVKCLKFKVPKVPKVKGTKMTITCFGPVFIGLKMGFPILSRYNPSVKRGKDGVPLEPGAILVAMGNLEEMHGGYPHPDHLLWKKLSPGKGQKT